MIVIISILAYMASVIFIIVVEIVNLFSTNDPPKYKNSKASKRFLNNKKNKTQTTRKANTKWMEI